MKNLNLTVLLAFLFIVFCYFILHLYVAEFFLKMSFIKNKILVKKIFVFLFLFSFLSLVLRTQVSGSLLEVIYFFAFFWMGIIFILGFYCFLSSLLMFFLKNLNKDLIIFFTFLLSFFSVIYSFYEGHKTPKVRQLSLNLNNRYKKLSFAFISDLHFDFRYKNKMAVKIFKEIEQLDPDFVIIGGDFLDPGFTLNENILQIKNFKFQKISVFGNHEYYFGLHKARQIFEELGFNVLKNNSILIGEINFIGLGDINTESLSKEEVLKIVSDNYKDGCLNILISHQPLYFKEISERFDVIMLSGHTHKGQIFPFHILTKIAYKYFYGLYKNKNSYLYVTSGAGVWGPPMRFFAGSEIVLINLL